MWNRLTNRTREIVAPGIAVTSITETNGDEGSAFGHVPLPVPAAGIGPPGGEAKHASPARAAVAETRTTTQGRKARARVRVLVLSCARTMTFATNGARASVNDHRR